MKIHGKPAPVLSVAMDQTFLDVTDIADVSVNDPVLILGRDNDSEVDIFQLLQGTQLTPMQLLCGISQRVPRIFAEEWDLAGKHI